MVSDVTKPTYLAKTKVSAFCGRSDGLGYRFRYEQVKSFDMWHCKVLPLLAMVVYKSKCRTRQVVRGRAFDKLTRSTALAGALEITFGPPARS